jgi:hypothetical protein
MGLEVIDDDLPSAPVAENDDFIEKTAKVVNVDSRRRLEDKIEEMRLRREMREFDFDD